jgi:hypothetical protein
VQSNLETASDERLPAAAVLRRYKIVDRTLKRWLDNLSLDFPRPLVVNGRRYFRAADLDQWERSRAAASYREVA